MKILLVAATNAEISILTEHFGLSGGALMKTEKFDLLVTGVGMTATAFALGKHLSNRYNLVLNLGIAGSFDTSIALGTVLNVVADDFSELGAEDQEQFLPIDDLGFGKSSYHAYNNLLHPSLSTLKKVKGITVNTVHGNAESIEAIKNRLHPVTESMEGAAVLYSCEEAGIPCLQIRSISNYVEPRNRESWKIGLAIKNLNDWAIGFLTNS